MIHGDNKGAVFPPKVAPTQVVIVPIIHKTKDNKELLKRAEEVYEKLKGKGIRVRLDDRDGISAGRKYNEWEMKGVPLRIEIGF